jgi:saccharopine dehydrogenase (NAD+, L-lysine-forming)
MIGTKLVYNGTWDIKGAKNVEEFDSDPFMQELNSQGLPWQIIEL